MCFVLKLSMNKSSTRLVSQVQDVCNIKALTVTADLVSQSYFFIFFRHDVRYLPGFIRAQLLLDRDPHGNVQAGGQSPDV